MRAMILCLLTLGLAGLLGAESAAGIQWKAPEGWQSQGSRPMRVVTYRVPPAQGDSEAGECAVYYFGAGQGGGVQANIDRWVGQFEDQSGKPVTAKQTYGGVSVTTVEVSGTYTGGAGPMAPAAVPQKGYKLLAAVAETPQGSVFFKFTGPAKTVTRWQQAFHTMLRSIHK